MGCDTTFVKNVLFFFSILIAVIGLGMFVFGVGFLVRWTLTADFHSTAIIGTEWGFIAIGLVTIIAGLLGCWGLVRGSYCGVVMYCILLVLIITAQVVMAILLLVFDGDVDAGYFDSLNQIFKERSYGDNSAQFVVANLQEQIKCCGDQGPQYYGNMTLPISCCASNSTEMRGTHKICNIDKAYKGCIPVLMDLSKQWGHRTMAGALIGISCVEFIGTIFAICHGNTLRNMDRRSRY